MECPHDGSYKPIKSKRNIDFQQPKAGLLRVRSRSEPATTGESNPQNLGTWRNWDPHFANLPTLGRAMSCYGVL